MNRPRPPPRDLARRRATRRRVSRFRRFPSGHATGPARLGTRPTRPVERPVRAPRPRPDPDPPAPLPLLTPPARDARSPRSTRPTPTDSPSPPPALPSTPLSSPQIRRSSYHNVVRVQDVCRMMDVSGIQTYVINSARVVFLSERPHPRGKGGSASGRGSARAGACRHCNRTLQADASDFCSISCKVSSGADMAPSEEAAAAAVEEPVRSSATATARGGKGDAKGGKTPKAAKEEPTEKRRARRVGAGSPRTPSDASRRSRAASDASPSPGTDGSGSVEATPTPSRRGAKRAPPSGSGVKREPATPATARGGPREDAGRSGSGSSAKKAKTSADGNGNGNGNGDGSFAVMTPPTFAPTPVLVSNSRRKNRPKRSPDA